MRETVLLRYRRCVCCDLAATEHTDFCAECLAEEEYRLRLEAPVPNFPTCVSCGAELSRHGHCLSDECTNWVAR